MAPHSIGSATRWLRPIPFLVIAFLAIGFVAWDQTSKGQTAFGQEPSRLETPQRIEFNRDIRPILSENCFYCHGPDAQHRQADLRLDRSEEAIEAAAILPGKASESTLIHRILSDDADLLMPPGGSNKKLTDAQKSLLRDWIDQGAEYQNHWAYEPPTRAIGSRGQSGASDSVDALVAEQLAPKGLKPAEQADPRTLVRRLYYDLIGLPPSPELVEAFVANPSEQAYTDLVESLLANPHFGERMAVGWLDIVRFADTIGYHSDNPRNIWPYRDYVIRSFNSDKPFDRFTLEQIAGDLLPDADQETRIGSAFNRLILSTEEGGAQSKDYEARMLADRVRAIGTVWLGQTIACAQCHDHKYDPITMKDFYSLGAFFSDIQEPIVGAREEGLAILEPLDHQRLAELDQAIEEATQKLNALKNSDSKTESQAAQEQMEKARKTRDAFYKSLPKCLVTQASPNPRTVRLLPRGNWMDESGPLMHPALPDYLLKAPSPANQNLAQETPHASERSLNRLDLAAWLVSKENPLTARVTMNRLWKHFFGTGLSKVLDDLGTQGETPVNPKLLDQLACEFIDSGWSFKHMVRAIVLSRTYRQSSQADASALALDPLNRWTARQSPFRMDAEFVRDYALEHAGLLARSIGGRSAKPYQPDGYWDSLNFPTRTYTPDASDQQYRRGLYTWWQRTFLHPSLMAFDAPSREECCAERNRSNLPQQALVLLNDPTYVEAARGLAHRTLTNRSALTDPERIEWMFTQVLCRQPSRSEQNALLELLDKQRVNYRANPESALRLGQTGLFQPGQSIDPTEWAAWTHPARVLLNLHETITRN
jgi:hypothetical protein